MVVYIHIYLQRGKSLRLTVSKSKGVPNTFSWKIVTLENILTELKDLTDSKDFKPSATSELTLSNFAVINSCHRVDSCAEWLCL